jgi:hypothetical protein
MIAGANMTPRRPKRRSPQAPGQFLGYSLQTTRAVMHLLAAEPGSAVSVEVLDDVATVKRSGKTKLEQTKSNSSTNPIANRSPEFWKTLANWVNSIQEGHLDLPSTSFEMFVSREVSGTIAASFSAANDETSARAVLEAAMLDLWGEAPLFPRRAAIGETLESYLDVVFRAPRAVVIPLIVKLTIAFGKAGSGPDLVSRFRAKAISDDVVSIVAQRMLGWTKIRIDSLIEMHRPAVIPTDEFNLELLSFVRKVDRFLMLNNMAPDPDPSMISEELKSRLYVQQLDLVDADYEAKLRAAADFLRAAANRTIWASKGMVNRSSFDEFEDVLIRTWSAKKEIVAVQASGHTPAEIGLMLYSECSLVTVELETRTVPPHFTSGCYHALADQLTVGWHGDFKKLLGEPARPKE